MAKFIEPPSAFFQLRKVKPPISRAGGQLNSSSLLIRPVCNAAMPTNTLKVGADGYGARKARGSSGMLGASCNALYSLVVMTGTNEFGLEQGHEAIASTSP